MVLEDLVVASHLGQVLLGAFEAFGENAAFIFAVGEGLVELKWGESRVGAHARYQAIRFGRRAFALRSLSYTHHNFFSLPAKMDKCTQAIKSEQIICI